MKPTFGLVFLVFLASTAAALARPFPNMNYVRCKDLPDEGVYVLFFTTPTGGYAVSFDGATVKKNVLTVAVKVVPPSGPATTALVTHRVRFELDASQRPVRYAVMVNGQSLGRAKLFDRAR